jgi:hypothetical protein
MINETVKGITMPLGWQLRQLMADRKMTNEELAKFISKSTGKKKHSVTISRWRQEDIMPKLDGKELGAIIESVKL